jgi:hypothetical protein
VLIFRHSGAKLRRDVGESVEEVSRFLDHSSLAVTTVYLRRLEGQADTGWAKVVAAIGMELHRLPTHRISAFVPLAEVVRSATAGRFATGRVGARPRAQAPGLPEIGKIPRVAP